MDDLLEEIVGDDIQDEFEADTSRDFYPLGSGQYMASGSIALFDLEEELPGLGDLENDAGISTLGGYITNRLDHLPELNEQIRIKDYLITVTGTDGRRVTQARIDLSPLAAPEDELQDDNEAFV